MKELIFDMAVNYYLHQAGSDFGKYVLELQWQLLADEGE